MNLNAELIALGLRALAEKGVIRRPDPLDNFVSALFTGQTVEQRRAEDITNSLSIAANAAKRVINRRKSIR